MFISIYSAGMPFNGSTIPSGKSLGGSESAAYYMARELVKLDHHVTVFTTHQECGIWDGVRYEWIGEIDAEKAPLGYRYHFAMRTPQDICIVQRHPYAFKIPPNAKLTIWWLHDIALHRNTFQSVESLVNTDLIFTVSEWHREQVSQVMGIDKKHIYATQNGVDYDMVEASLADPKLKKAYKPKTLCFASRPERGLEALVGKNSIMEKLPDYTLYICGYDNNPAHMQDFYRYLYDRCNELPNVQLLGYLSKSNLYQLMSSCQAVVYPTMFEDTSNIVAMEAAACGTPFIGMDIGAVPETTKYHTSHNSFALLLNPINNKVDNNQFATAISSLCENQLTYDRKKQAALGFKQSWQDIAAKWIKLFEHIFKARSVNDAELMKHFEHVSDIVAMRTIWSDDEITKVLPDFKSNYDFLINNNFADHYKRYYEYEKNRGVQYGPETLDNNSRFNCISDIVKASGASTVMDYGCAHGHYTINLAKRFPDKLFQGIDLAQSNIDICNKWADDDNVVNVRLKQANYDSLSDDTYDLIIAAEVLEHVADPGLVVNTLLTKLNPGGTMCISVPYGPWEAFGYKEHVGWRAHIHHLERQDLLELFGNFDDYKCLALPSSGDVGHYVLTFTKPNDDRQCGAIDYYRKVEQQRPLETLSVCMIAYNESNIIGRCLDSVKEFASEIIIGIDKCTTDNTAEIAKKYGAKCFEIESPLVQGFDSARNETIAKATSEWILWIDADETLENAHLLPAYLRKNCYDGYLINQHHYSAEPAELLQTDMPCRIFRNNRGIRFFGKVHEHPSVEHGMNFGPGKVFNIPNIHIMHTGYGTEAKRRGRFRRNFPLMVKDREVYPGRLLGKFLYVRDLAHSISYDRERTEQTTEFQIETAKAAIKLWAELLDDLKCPVRFIVESLRYYTACSTLLGAQIVFEALIKRTEIKGVFFDAETVLKLVHRVTAETVQIFNERYF